MLYAQKLSYEYPTKSPHHMTSMLCPVRQRLPQAEPLKWLSFFFVFACSTIQLLLHYVSLDET
uniref:Uncharacterized protein n=1 Tax=Arundo donax TaxID=35708 RepID=A0A0A9CVX8_ARUDO